MKRKGISLIVLIITIVVIIILAAAIILNLSNTNIIENANEAVVKQDVKTFQDELTMYIADQYVNMQGDFKAEDLYAIDQEEIEKIIPSIKGTKYEGKIAIEAGNLSISDDMAEPEKTWAMETLNKNGVNEEYVKDGLILYLDGINNTGNGHSSNATVWRDLSGKGNDGVLKNIGNAKESGWNGNYLALDGIDDYVDLGLLGYEYPNGITMAMVVRFNEIDVIKAEEFLGNWGGGGGGLGLYSGREITSNLYIEEAGKYIAVSAKEAVEYTRDYVIYVTYDSHNLKLYVDGELNDTNAIEGKIKAAEVNMCIGANPGINSTIDGSYSKIFTKKVMIYDRALTEEEIQQNYSVDKKRFGI